ncbi:cyclic AMP-AMP-AMP synthase-like isoform X2 [Corticium candelabrum]|uniref:cyclic AMP-AMP-AMP synthase-like isoform X2 n=1 Tax=Corticium candelabrum TaxID=121492 RepID=UPI002E25C876|nr:cyclic AMP-AMP-AMP synthase-like isoform X2 [Corticium candelabrum]
MATMDIRFSKMLQRIRPDEGEVERAIRSHHYMRNRLEEKEWVLTTFLTGSYPRKTATRPLHDVDILCVVDPHWARPKTAANIQTHVEHALQTIYRNTSIRRQSHSLGVDFSSQRVGYDVIPAVPHGEYYMITERDSSHRGGRFIPCHPKAVEEAKVRANACTKPEGRMLHMIRLMKHWNCKNGKKIKNFHIEVLCYSAADVITSDRYPYFHHACPALLEFLAETVEDDCFVPGLEAFELGNLRKTRAGIELRAFSNTLVNAAAKANMAVYRERQGDDRTANKIWQDLFDILE